MHVTQIAFMKGRNISSGIMCLHEIMDETKRNNEIGVLFKIDFTTKLAGGSFLIAFI
jgi:hypothetical protein